MMGSHAMEPQTQQGPPGFRHSAMLMSVGIMQSDQEELS